MMRSSGGGGGQQMVLRLAGSKARLERWRVVDARLKLVTRARVAGCWGVFSTYTIRKSQACVLPAMTVLCGIAHGVMISGAGAMEGFRTQDDSFAPYIPSRLAFHATGRLR